MRWWLRTHFVHPLSPKEVLEVNELVRNGKTVTVEVTNQRTMCQAKGVLQTQGNITIVRKEEGSQGCIQFEPVVSSPCQLDPGWRG